MGDQYRLYYNILYYTILCYIILYHIMLYYATLYYIILCYIMLHYIYYTILYYNTLYYIVLYYTTLYHIILYYIILYYIIIGYPKGSTQGSTDASSFGEGYSKFQYTISKAASQLNENKYVKIRRGVSTRMVHLFCDVCACEPNKVVYLMTSE